MKLGFIGTGNMGGALARAAAKAEDAFLLLYDPDREKAEALLASIGGKGEVTDRPAEDAALLFLGVKPYLLAAALEPHRAALKCPLVSMLAGTSIETIQAALGQPHPVIRIMPNIPAAAGEGMMLYDCSLEVTPEQEALFLRVMAGSGRVERVEEHLIDAGSAVSGCGPAFAAMFLEALADGAVACGLPRRQAILLAAQTMRGTASLLLQTGDHPGALKDAVCSPGGTTIQGVRALEEAGFRGAVMDAVIAAYEKTIGK